MLRKMSGKIALKQILPSDWNRQRIQMSAKHSKRIEGVDQLQRQNNLAAPPRTKRERLRDVFESIGRGDRGGDCAGGDHRGQVVVHRDDLVRLRGLEPSDQPETANGLVVEDQLQGRSNQRLLT